MILDELAQIDRKVKLDLHFMKKRDYFDPELFAIASKFLNDYCNYHQLSAQEILKKYQHFLTEYSADLKEFKNSGKYPQELGINRKIDRIAYDLPLILSVLVNGPRHQIMSRIKESAEMIAGHGSIIGVGPGLEIDLLMQNLKEGAHIKAFDTHLSQFPKEKFVGFDFREELFKAENSSLDFVYAIELMEHITEPYQLMEEVSKTLKKGGYFFFTTATDMPQFDHLFNFKNDEEMEKRLQAAQFEIIEKTDHFHNYLGGPKSAKNTWYICKKLG